jgi:hypothetical protein
MVFRIFLLLLFNVGLEAEHAYAQNSTRRIPPSDSVVSQNQDKLVEMMLDSTMQAVQDLKEIPKLIDKGTKRNKTISKNLDVSYYRSILPLKALEPRHAFSAHTIPVRVNELPAIQQVTFLNNELCIDSLPYRVTPEAALSRQKVRFFQKVKNWFR